MKVIYRNNRRFNNKNFNTYEEARNYVRRWLRKAGEAYINMSALGFSIK